jgi:hypothetical protein
LRPVALRTGVLAAQRPATVSATSNRKELKALVNIGTGAAGTTAGTLNLVSAIAINSTPDGRDGNTIRLKGLQWGVQLQKPSSFGVAVSRFIVFRWDQGYRNPTVADILVSPSVSGVYSPYNHNTTKQFKILVDKTYVLKGEFNGTGGAFRDDIKIDGGNVFDDKICTFQDDTGTTSDSKYWVLFINSFAGSTTNWFNTSVKYVDV